MSKFNNKAPLAVLLFVASVPTMETSAKAASILGFSLNNGTGTVFATSCLPAFGCNTASPTFYNEIGVANTGSGNNTFLNNLSTGAINIADGKYLLFFGAEGTWAPGNDSIFKVLYSDSTTKTTTFLNGAFGSPSVWTFQGGDPTLSLGSSGITNIDRMSDGSPTTPIAGKSGFGSNGLNDVILQFTDTAAANTPEPSSGLSLAFGLLVLSAFSWVSRRKVI